MTMAHPCLPTEKSNHSPSQPRVVLPWRETVLVYYTSVDTEQRTGEAQDPGRMINAVYSTYT